MKLPITLGMILIPALLTGSSSAPSQRSAAQRTNRPPKIESFTAIPFMDLPLCPWMMSETCSDEVIIGLRVSANDLDGDVLSYSYRVTSGVITGNGPAVAWELKKIGTFTATVEVVDRKGGKDSASVEHVVRPCASSCDPPPCPVVDLTCPVSAVAGDRVVFEASVTGTQDYEKDNQLKLRFDWQVANGRIIKGQGTPRIQVKVAMAPDEQVMATVRVHGLRAACLREASCSKLIQRK